MAKTICSFGAFADAKSFCRIAAALLIALPQSLRANPTGGEVAAGAAAISANGSTLTVIQASNNAIINWRDFSISQGELTRFIQPSALSAALNRVTGGDPSAIYGTLQANGRVFLINPNGITVGPTGVINTQSFVASTLDLNNDQFMAGGPLRFSGGSAANLVNAGRINALGGDVILIAHTVRNTGDIEAPQGTAALAAGTEVLLQPSGDERVFVRAGGADRAAVGVDQQGRISAAAAELKAAGGNVYSLAINNAGLVQATGVERRGGRVYLIAEGGNIALKSGSVIDASGANGGGTVLVGGDAQGANAAVPNASVVTVEEGAAIMADSLENGDGGKVVVWGADSTSFRGTISAKGGAEGGNGGSVEVSGGRLDFSGMVDVTAPRGLLGSLLLDPYNLTISNSADAAVDTANPDSSAGDGSNLSVATLVGQLANANVTVQTGGDSPSSQLGDITVADAITWGGPTAGSLTLKADNNIIVNAAITSNGGGEVQLSANDGNGTIVLNSNITTTGGVQTYTGDVALGGDVTLNTGGGDLRFSGDIDSAFGGARSLTVGSGIGSVRFAGAIGDATALSSLDIAGDGVAYIDGGIVRTVGRQRYDEAVVLGGAGANTVLTSAGDGVVFRWTVDGGKNLSIDSGAGDVEFKGFVGLGTALSSLDISGGVTARTIIDGGAVTTAGAQRYGEAVVLGGQGTDTQLSSGGGVAFDRTVDGGKNLIIGSGAGDVTFTGAVGDAQALRALYIDGDGVAHIDGGIVTTEGKQRYNEAVVLGGAGESTVLTSADEGVVFRWTVDGGRNLSIASGAGDVEFEGFVGGGTALSSLDISGGATARTIINGGAVTTGGAQRYGEAVILGGQGTDTEFASGGGVTFERTVDGGKNLIIGSGAGDVTFSGAVGAAEALRALFIDGAGVTHIDGGIVTTAGKQRYGEAVVLGANAALTSADEGVDFDGAVDGGKNLIIASGEGDVLFSGAVGGAAALGSLDITGGASARTIINGGAVTTDGAQRYGARVVLGADAALSSRGGGIAFDGSVNGEGNLTLDAGAGVAWSAALAARNLRIFGKDILMGGDVSSGGADGVLMVAGNSFRNAGSHAITTTGGGRFLIYSVGPERNILGGLVGFTQYGTAYMNGVHPGFLGNGLLYSDPAWAPPSLSVNYGALNSGSDPFYGWLHGGGKKPAVEEGAGGEVDDNGSASSSDLFAWDLGTMRDAVASADAPPRKKKKRK